MHLDDATVFVILASCFIAVALIVVSITYVRAIRTLNQYLRAKQPAGWDTILTLGGGREPRSESIADYGLFGLVEGTMRLPIQEEEYRRLLRSVRRRLFIWLGLWVTLVGVIGWGFRGTMP